MVDLHTHILPKMDDGSGAVGTSLAMLRREAEQGVDAVCATSHYYAHHEGIGAFCARRAEALERLTSVLTDDLPRVLPAAPTTPGAATPRTSLRPSGRTTSTTFSATSRCGGVTRPTPSR